MKLQEIIVGDSKKFSPRGRVSLTPKQYRSKNAKKGGVIRWSYSSGKKANNAY